MCLDTIKRTYKKPHMSATPIKAWKGFDTYKGGTPRRPVTPYQNAHYKSGVWHDAIVPSFPYRGADKSLIGFHVFADKAEAEYTCNEHRWKCVEVYVDGIASEGTEGPNIGLYCRHVRVLVARRLYIPKRGQPLPWEKEASPCKSKSGTKTRSTRSTKPTKRRTKRAS